MDKITKLKKRLGYKAYCSVLSGDSSYNLCINSDLTVSCNCQDYDGAGQLGDLKKNSLGEIFKGPVAHDFRQKLAKGILPIKKCGSCPELHFSKKKIVEEKNRNCHVPDQNIMVENTVLCNLKCKYCKRSVVDQRSSKSMSLEDIERVAQTVKNHKIQSINYFNLGETFLSDNILEELKIIRKYNPDINIRASTNGMLLNTDIKRQAAMMLNLIRFSIDGAGQDSASRYQKGINFAQAFENMKNLVAFRDQNTAYTTTLVWKYVVFRWNDSREEIKKAIQLAKDIHIDRILFAKGGTADRSEKSIRFDKDPFFKFLGEMTRHGIRIILNK